MNSITPAEAFERYYELGVKRNLLRLSKIIGIEFDLLASWADGYAWDEKVEARDKEINRVFEQVYKQRTLDIRNRLVRQIDTLLKDMESCSLGLPFGVNSPAELRCVAQAYRELVQANVLAMTKGVDMGGGKAPKTWSDLLAQIENTETE
jgi:hypothetical protein